MSKTADIRFMGEAIELARRGEGWTNPNPMVGAVIVKNGRVIGRGFHRRAGLAHAEVEALRSARESVRGATLYSNLEPCSHFGRTPPCTEAIVAAGISRVVFASADPNPNVDGKGAARLRAARISVGSGVLRKEAEELNEQFIAFHTKHRPFVALKFAASLDGKLATRTGDSKWITNAEARAFGRRLRAKYQAILVGSGTARADNPHLGARTAGARDPLRIVLDSKLETPLSSRVYRDRNALAVTTSRAALSRREAFARKGIDLLVFNGRISVRKLMKELYARQIVSLLVEGGGEVLGSFLDAGFVDIVYAAHAPLLIGGRRAVTVAGRGAATIADAKRFRRVSREQIGSTMITIARP